MIYDTGNEFPVDYIAARTPFNPGALAYPPPTVTPTTRAKTTSLQDWVQQYLYNRLMTRLDPFTRGATREWLARANPQLYGAYGGTGLQGVAYPQAIQEYVGPAPPDMQIPDRLVFKDENGREFVIGDPKDIKHPAVRFGPNLIPYLKDNPNYLFEYLDRLKYAYPYTSFSFDTGQVPGFDENLNYMKKIEEVKTSPPPTLQAGYGNRPEEFVNPQQLDAMVKVLDTWLASGKVGTAEYPIAFSGLPTQVRNDLLGLTTSTAEPDASATEKKALTEANKAAANDVAAGLNWLREALNLSKGAFSPTGKRATRAQQNLVRGHLATLAEEAAREPGRSGRYTTLLENILNPVMSRRPISGILGASRALVNPGGDFNRKGFSFRNPEYT